MYSRGVTFFKLVVFRVALMVGVLVVAACWAALFLGYLLLVGLSQIKPTRGVDPPERVVSTPGKLESEKTRTTA